MICLLSQWFISNASDKKRAIPKFVLNHLTRCRPCRHFYGLASDLEKNAASQARAVLKKVPESLFEKASSRRPAFTGMDAAPRAKRRLVPLLSASAGIFAVIFLTILLLLPPKQQQPFPSNENFSLLLSRDTLSVGTLQQVASRVDAPFDEEWTRLRNAMRSAARYLTEQLDLRISPPLNQ